MAKIGDVCNPPIALEIALEFNECDKILSCSFVSLKFCEPLLLVLTTAFASFKVLSPLISPIYAMLRNNELFHLYHSPLNCDLISGEVISGDVIKKVCEDPR